MCIRDSLIGGVTEEDHTVSENNFTQDQWQSLEHLIDQLEERHLGAKIIGHNEISEKDCPAFDVQKWNNERH